MGMWGGNPISQADPLGLDAEAVMAALPAAVAVAMADSPIPGPADVAVGVALAALAVMPGDTTRPESTDQTCPVPASNSSDKWTCQGYENYEIIGQNKHVVRGAWIVAYGKTEQIAAKNWKKAAQASSPLGHTARHIRPRCWKIK